MTRASVENRIDEAFADASIPERETEIAPPSIEAPYVVEHFLGRSRADIDRSTFRPSLHVEDFTYMTQQAVEYYLPPVLKLMLTEPHDDELWVYLSGFLGGARHAYARNLRALSREQHEAIADWFDFIRDALVGTLGFDPSHAAKLAELYRQLAQDQ